MVSISPRYQILIGFWVVLLACIFFFITVNEMGREQSPLSILEQRLSADPENIEILKELAKFYLIEGKDRNAIKLYKQILEIDPSQLIILENLATLYEKQGMYADSYRSYDRAIRQNGFLDPDYFCEVYYPEVSFRDCPQTVKAYEDGLKLPGVQLVFIVKAAKAFCECERYEQARELLETNMYKNLTGKIGFEFYYILGIARERQNDLVGALKAFAAARQRANITQEASALYNLGKVYSRMEKPREASQALRDAFSGWMSYKIANHGVMLQKYSY